MFWVFSGPITPIKNELDELPYNRAIYIKAFGCYKFVSIRKIRVKEN
jgi:hypothetical protein